MTASERLAELDAEVARLTGKVAELDAAERTARRSLARAKAPLVDYMEGLGGDEPDPERVRQLTAQVQAAGAMVELRPATANDPATGTARFIGVDAIDAGAEARLRGARVALQEAQEAANAFAREHVVALLREWAPEAVAVTDRVAAAIGDLAAADADWSRLFAQAAALGRRSGAFDVDDLPDGPLSREAGMEVARAARVARKDRRRLLPLPAELLELS